MGRLLLAFFVCHNLLGAEGELQRVERFELHANSDISAAKIVSGLDLFSVAINACDSAEGQLAGKFIVRAALDKPRYRLGEPIHLFLYRLHHSTEHTFRPGASGWEIIRPTVVDRQNAPVPLTPMGQWHASFSNLFVISSRYFPTNRVLIDHIDLVW